MQQIVSITDARNNLSQLVKQVTASLEPVVIVRDSEPEVALVPYAKIIENEKLEKLLWNLRWEELLKETKKAGKRWAKKNKINLKTISEEKLYELIKAL